MASEKRSEDWYYLHAQSGCDNCSGNGMISYHFECDTTVTAPCDRCFPDDKRAVETARRFYGRA
jgi:excinuclease UvrABC ATPase subunit